MNCRTKGTIKKAFNLLIASLFLCDLSMGSYAFAGSEPISEKIQVQNKPDAAYSASQLTKRDSQAKETVDSKNDMLNNTSSPAESEISAEDFRIQFEESQRSAQRVLGEIGPIVHMAAETLLDTRIHEDGNSAAERMESLEANSMLSIISNDGNPDISMSLGSRPIAPETRESLVRLFYWAEQSSGDADMSLYLGNNIELSFSGKDSLLTIKGGGYVIKVEYFDPQKPHVHLKTISCVREAFDSIENTKKTLDDNMMNSEEGDKKTAQKMERYAPIEQGLKKTLDDNMMNFEENSKKTGQKMEPNIQKAQEPRGPIVKKQDSSSLYTAKPRQGPSENKATKSTSSNKSIFNAKSRKGVPENASVKDTDQREVVISNATVDHATVLKGEWGEAKGALIKVFERVLAEDPGAVYSGGNGSINAIILLTAAVAPNSKDKEGEKDKDS